MHLLIVCCALAGMYQTEPDPEFCLRPNAQELNDLSDLTPEGTTVAATELCEKAGLQEHDDREALGWVEEVGRE